MNARSLLIMALAFAIQFARADDDTTTATTTTTTTTTTAAPTPAPKPSPGDNPLDDGKKFGISVLVYVCCLIVWIGFLFAYGKIVDHCKCCQKKDGPADPSQKYATAAPGGPAAPVPAGGIQ